MRRELSVPRANWQAKVEALGLNFHTPDGHPYWYEEARYAFSSDEIDAIEEATNTLHQLCLDVVDRLVSSGNLDRLSIPKTFWPWIAESWRRKDPELFGRFDLAFDGTGPAKMLEYNADTPTALLEAAVVQWYWLEETRPNCDQFNLIHERLIEVWNAIHQRMTPSWSVHFSAVSDEPEDLANAEYMRDVCNQAGIKTVPLDISEIGWNGRYFTDLEEQPIHVLFKLYPWEWLVREDFSAWLRSDNTAFIEPPWKMILSNKAILPILWEMFPNHPNLLPAAFDRGGIIGPCVEKPVHGREGADIRILGRDEAGKDEDGLVYQSLCPLPKFGEHHALVGSWVIGGKAAGIGMREDSQPITRNTSRFVPHYFTGSGGT